MQPYIRKYRYMSQQNLEDNVLFAVKLYKLESIYEIIPA